MTLLQTHNLDAYYLDFQALYGVSISLDAGQIVAIIGPNGAGKTTLLRSLAGWVPVERGCVTFDDESIGGFAAEKVVALGIASVPEGRRLFHSLSVEENLLMGQESNRSGDWSTDTVFDLFPVLQGLRKRRGSDLSGGEQQMVAIGRALMANPKVLLFDELSLGLAPTIVGDICRTLPVLRDKGVSMIVVEQDVRRALDLSDYVYCILEGKINLEGESNELAFDDVANAFFGV